MSSMVTQVTSLESNSQPMTLLSSPLEATIRLSWFGIPISMTTTRPISMDSSKLTTILLVKRLKNLPKIVSMTLRKPNNKSKQSDKKKSKPKSKAKSKK